MDRIKNLSLDQKAKLYYMALLQKGMIDRLPEDPKAAYIRDMMDKENPKMDPAIRSDFDDPMFEGDTYEKMAAKGKKRGNLKQGTVRKRLKIKDGEKIPLSKITKAISKIKKMKNPSEKNKKYLKALNLAKTLKTTTNVREMANELGYINEEENYQNLPKPDEISLSYTDPGFRFYGMYLYKDGNRFAKISYEDRATKYLKNLGIKTEVPRRYDTDTLDKIKQEIEALGIEGDYSAAMDVS